jgi:hypothetical protein
MSTRDRSKDAQAIARASLITRKQVRNITRVGRKPYVAVPNARAHVPAIIVGGGVSLDEVGHLLPEAAKHALVIACNTSLGACHHHGVQADYVVAIEALPILDVMDGLVPGERLVCSLGANEAIFDAADGWFVSSSGHSTRLALDLGVEVVGHGGRATLAGFGLARLWGCDPIVLVGMSGLVTDGHGYAEGASWRGWMTELHIPEGYAEHTGRSDRDELHDSLGTIRPVRKEPIWEVPTWSGERGYTSKAFTEQGLWLEEQATLGWPSRLVHADPDGLELEGWEHAGLDEALHREGPLPDCFRSQWDKWFRRVDATEAIRSLRREAETATAMLDAFEKHAMLPVDDLAEGVHMVSGLAISELIRQRQPGPASIAERQRACVQAERDAAEQMAELLEG